MTLLSTLVKAIAEVEGLDETRVGWIARHCREAGLITQAGRGRGAAKMSVQDAANLLIAVNASDGGKESYNSVGEYRRLSVIRSQYDRDHWEAISNSEGKRPFEYISKLDLKFGQALEYLIDLCISENDGESDFEKQLNRNIQDFSIEFERPRPAVSISISAFYDEEDDEVMYAEILRASFGEHITQRTVLAQVGDRTEKIEITGRTLVAVGKALAS